MPFFSNSTIPQGVPSVTTYSYSVMRVSRGRVPSSSVYLVPGPERVAMRWLRLAGRPPPVCGGWLISWGTSDRMGKTMLPRI